MKSPTEQEINEAHSAIDWSESTCGIQAAKDPNVALLFDEPHENPDRAVIARKLCISCPILETCLMYAIKYETPMGYQTPHQADTLMAGFSLRERQKMKATDWWDKVKDYSA